MGEIERREVPKKTVQRREKGWQSAAQNSYLKNTQAHTSS